MCTGQKDTKGNMQKMCSVAVHVMKTKSPHLPLTSNSSCYFYLAHHPVVAQVKFGTEDSKEMRSRQYFKGYNSDAGID